MGILKNGSIKRNGDLALPQLETRIVEEDEEEEAEAEAEADKEQEKQETKIEINENTNTKEKNEEDKKAAVDGASGSPQTSNEPTVTTKDVGNNENKQKETEKAEGN